MSVDRECNKYGEEYDARHGGCPVCRMSEPKYKWVPVERVRIEGHDGYLINTKSGAFFQRTGVRNAWDTPMSSHEHIMIDLCEMVLAAAPSPPQDPRDEALRVAREALDSFGRHRYSCNTVNSLGDSPCSCGLYETVLKIKELMGEK